MSFSKKRHIFESNIILEQRFLFEQITKTTDPEIDVPKSDYSYSWVGDNSVPTAQINPNSFREQGMGTTQELVDDADAEKIWEEAYETIHNVLGWTSFIVGFIPHPIAQGVSAGLDIINAGVYANEGKYFESGLYAVLAVAPFAVEPLIKTTAKSIEVLKYSNRLKNLGSKLSTREGLRNLTRGEQNALLAMRDNRFLKGIEDAYNTMAKQNLESFLIKPDLFRRGYSTERLIKMYSRTTSDYMIHQALLQNRNDIALSTLNFFIDMGVYVATDLAINYVFKNYVKPLETMNLTTKEKIEKMGYDFDEVMKNFGGDINSERDIEKLNKAWNDKSIKSNTVDKDGYIEEVKGWRPSFLPDGTTNKKLGLTSVLPCEYYASKKTIGLETSPCWKVLTKKMLENKNIKGLPYEYKRDGGVFYYAKIGSYNWIEVTDEKTRKFLEEQIFSQFK